MEETRVLFVCLGNICRSPLAQGVFEGLVGERGLTSRYVADSAGTSAYHVGETPDPGSVRVARQMGLEISAQRSRQITRRDFEAFDYIVAMDRANRRAIEALATAEPTHLVLVRAFDEASLHDFDVPDPWGGGLGGFREVYEILARAMPNLLAHMEHHGPSERTRHRRGAGR